MILDYNDPDLSSSSSSTLRPAVWDQVAKTPGGSYGASEIPPRPLPKPKGEVGRSGSKGGVNRGYNLEATLQWPSDLFKEVQEYIKNLAEDHFDMSQSYNKQSSQARNTVLNLAREQYSFLSSYEHDWVTIDFLYLYMRNRYNRRNKLDPQRHHLSLRRSQDSLPGSNSQGHNTRGSTPSPGLGIPFEQPMPTLPGATSRHVSSDNLHSSTRSSPNLDTGLNIAVFGTSPDYEPPTTTARARLISMPNIIARSDLPTELERPADNYVQLPIPEYLTPEGQKTLQNVFFPRVIQWAACLDDPWRTSTNMRATVRRIWGELYPQSSVMNGEYLAVIEAKVNSILARWRLRIGEAAIEVLQRHLDSLEKKGVVDGSAQGHAIYAQWMLSGSRFMYEDPYKRSDIFCSLVILEVFVLHLATTRNAGFDGKNYPCGALTLCVVAVERAYELLRRKGINLPATQSDRPERRMERLDMSMDLPFVPTLWDTQTREYMDMTKQLTTTQWSKILDGALPFVVQYGNDFVIDNNQPHLLSTGTISMSSSYIYNASTSG